MHRRSFLLFSLLFTAPPALSSEEPPSFCHSMRELAPQVKDCNTNAIFAKAAQVCVSKIENEIERQKLQLAALMAVSSAAAGSAQAARIGNNAQNLSDLRASIDRLTADAQRARREVIVYSENFVYPGSYTKAMLERKGLLNAFKHFSCYKNNIQAVGQAVSTFNERITEFQKVAESARALEARTTVALKKVDSSSVARPVANRAPASLGAPIYAAPPPRAKQGPSDLSGTEKIGESDRALQKLTNQPPRR